MKNSGNRIQVRTVMLSAALLPVALCASGPVAAASKTSQARVTISQPVTMSKKADLLFGDFATGTTDSVFRINPHTGLLSQHVGDAVSLGGTQSLASIEVTGTALMRVQISTGIHSILIRRTGGTETMRIDRFRFDSRQKILDADGEQSFNIGGQLRVGANQRAGTYRGTFDVSIDYY